MRSLPVNSITVAQNFFFRALKKTLFQGPQEEEVEVILRVCPIFSDEESIVSDSTGNVIEIHAPKDKENIHEFSFDSIFDETTTQEDIFKVRNWSRLEYLTFNCLSVPFSSLPSIFTSLVFSISVYLKYLNCHRLLKSISQRKTFLIRRCRFPPSLSSPASSRVKMQCYLPTVPQVPERHLPFKASRTIQELYFCSLTSHTSLLLRAYP